MNFNFLTTKFLNQTKSKTNVHKVPPTFWLIGCGTGWDLKDQFLELDKRGGWNATSWDTYTYSTYKLSTKIQISSLLSLIEIILLYYIISLHIGCYFDIIISCPHGTTWSLILRNQNFILINVTIKINFRK